MSEATERPATPSAPEREGLLPVAIKPLEWREARVSDRRERFVADSPVGSYEALEWSASGLFGGTLPGRGEYDAWSLDEAKAIAQADFAARVRSCLITTPGLEKAVATLEEISGLVGYLRQNRPSQ